MGNSTSAHSRRPDPTTAASSTTLPQRRSWMNGSSPSLPRKSRIPSSGLGRITFSQVRTAQQPPPQAQRTTALSPVTAATATSDSYESLSLWDRTEIGCFSFRHSTSESARRESLSGVPAPTQPVLSLATVPQDLLSAVPPIPDVSPAPSTAEASAPPATAGPVDESQIQQNPRAVMESADGLGSELDGTNQESATDPVPPSPTDIRRAPQDIPTNSPTETGALPVTDSETRRLVPHDWLSSQTLILTVQRVMTIPQLLKRQAILKQLTWPRMFSNLTSIPR
ncbi:hypothetical protein DFJ73DRAFT_38713 [Zopfochytrium polystomum]|nr:hypothetical protein DFJ73DRAFT_399180 [Zopfochytrium polystomum]KAI9334365.1 hypothetical protein DFJ73DRAFT_38713 [Zopfochytrium polystomum]